MLTLYYLLFSDWLLGALVAGAAVVVVWRAMAGCRGRGPGVAALSGTVEGSVITTVGGARVYSYRGIPYGRPPVGELRLQKPQPAESWAGVRNCRGEASKSRQPNVLAPEARYLDVGEEDCLKLSVFTKVPPREEKETTPLLPDPGERSELMPVVVFLHGGAFQVGSCESALYGPQVPGSSGHSFPGLAGQGCGSGWGELPPGSSGLAGPGV